jgi:hypothetical protein
MDCPYCKHNTNVEVDDYSLYHDGYSDCLLFKCLCEDCRIDFNVKYRVHLESPEVTYIEAWGEE